MRIGGGDLRGIDLAHSHQAARGAGHLGPGGRNPTLQNSSGSVFTFQGFPSLPPQGQGLERRGSKP